MHNSSKNIITNKHIFYISVVLISIASGFALSLPAPYNLIPFGVILGAVFMITTFKYPMVGVYLYMFIFFFRPQEWTPIQLPYEKVIALVIIMTLLMHITFRDKKFDLFQIDKALLAFMAVCFVSIIFSGDIMYSWDVFFEFFKIFLVYVFASRIANTPKRFNSIIWLFVLSQVFLAVSTSYNYYTGGAQLSMGIDRATGLAGADGAYSDANSVANSLVLGIPFIYFLMKFHKSTLMKLFLIGVLGITCWTIIITGSRGGMVGVIIISMLLAYTTKYRTISTIGAIGLLAVFIVFMPSQYRERFSTIFHIYEEDGSGAAESAQGRIDGLVKGVVFMSQKPVFGCGIGSFKWENRQQYGIWLDAHNMLGKLMGELGLMGLLTFGFFLYIIFKTLQMIKYIYHKYEWEYDFERAMIDGISYSFIMLAFQGLIGHNLFRFNWYIYACFVVIITMIVNQRIEMAKLAEKIEQPIDLEVIEKNT